jgi:photosystem II CP47 chlorophyll apoprotein
MPTFFETFPTLFLDSTGVVRAEAKYSLDAPGTVAGLARTAQFGELLDFDRTSNLVDGVLRTSVRGWYTFAHLCFGLLFLFGHWWHASRTLYRDLLSGLESDASTLVEFGAFRKVSRRKRRKNRLKIGGPKGS